MHRIPAIATLVAFAAAGAAAQDTVVLKKLADEKAQIELGDMLQKVQIVGLEGGVMSNVKGAPYSAEQVRENSQTLADGTRIHTENSVKLYRDGQGRTRRESPEMISIFDPVSGVGYTLYPKTLTGAKMRVALKTGPNSVSWTATSSSADGDQVRVVTGSKIVNQTDDSGSPVNAFPMIGLAKQMTNAKVESLGTQTMEGVSARGERRTRTIEVGEIGNDRPIQLIDEHWYSPDLQMDIMTSHSDPRSGESTMRVINVQRGEPDPSLFSAPAEYQISDRPLNRLPAILKPRQ